MSATPGKVDNEAEKLDEIKSPWPVTLNIGGHCYIISRRTLMRRPTLFNALLLNRQIKAEADGSYFISRDHAVFRYILNFLRTGVLSLPATDDRAEEAAVLNEILLEAQFYQVQELVDELTQPRYQLKGVIDRITLPKAFSGSVILSLELRKTLVEWMGEEKECKLLYRGSRDGWDVGTFHFLCDNKGPTVTVVRRGSSIFGGYTALSWAGNGNKTDPSAFLFTLVNGAGLEPRKLALKAGEEDQAIFCHPNGGPVFGQGRDLSIVNHANRNENNRSRLDSTYECPDGQVETLFMAGTLTFVVDEYEVFSVA